MSERRVQSAVLLAILVLVAVFAWACGSGDEATTTTMGGVVPTAPPPVTTPGENGLVGTVVRATESTPAEYVDAIAQARPVVVLFYVPGGADDAKVLESVTTLQSSFSSYVFLVYDHKSPDAYGDLSTLLEVDYPPQLVLIDATGTVRDVWTGYVDQGTINQGLVNLGGG